MPKCILVTGGSGFIGSHICRALIEQGDFVVCADDYSGGEFENIYDLAPHSQFIAPVVDCTKDWMVEDIFKKYKPDAVYHLAANARESASFFQPVSIIQRNIVAYTHVLKNAIKHGTKRIILFSSIAVYGHQTPPFTEGMGLHPADLYGLAKATMEQMTRMLSASHGVEYVIFRPHNVFGVGQALCDPFRNVVGIWLNRIMRNEPLIIYGDGRQERAFSYIDNSLPCYLKALEVSNGSIFNIGSDQPWTLSSLATVVLEAMGAPDDYPIEYLPDRHGEVKSVYASHEKAKDILELRELVSVIEGVKRMAEWAKSKGPQDWRAGDNLEIPNSLTPRNWS